MSIRYAVGHVILYGLAKVFFRYEAVGGENIPESGPFLLASNHASYLDPPLVGLGVRRQIYFLAKKELFNTPLGLIFRAFNAIPVDRDRMERQTLKQMLGLFKKGEGLLIFPEGTRSDDGSLKEAKQGVGLITYLARVPVIPAYLKGSDRILPRRAKFVRPSRCTVYYGKPVVLEQLYSQERSRQLYREIGSEIMRGIGALKNEYGR